jgi:hypothetical protein
MLPKWHIFINFILCIILLILIKPFYVLIIFLTSFLIDIDHYLYYVFEKKRFSLKSAYNWYIIKRKQFHELSLEEKKKHRYFIFSFHGIEFLVIVYLLSFLNPIFIYILIGLIIHLIEDLIIAMRYKYINRKLFLTYAIYLHIKNKVN